jgi:hypothetical protein
VLASYPVVLFDRLDEVVEDLISMALPVESGT